MKFTQSENIDILRAQLLGTGNRELLYTSPHKVYGIGLDAEAAEMQRQAAGMTEEMADVTKEWYDLKEEWGANMVGKALMKVRQRLRDEFDPWGRRKDAGDASQGERER